MKSLTTIAVLAVAGVAASAGARPIIFNTGFEAPTYAAGALNGQDGWAVGDLPSGVIPAGQRMNVVNNPANAFAGSQYCEASTSAWPADTTSSTYRVSYGYQGSSGITAASLVANPIVHVSTAIRMNTPTGRRGGFATINNYDFPAFANLGALGVAWTGAGIATSGPFATANTSYLYVANANGSIVLTGGTPTDFLNVWLQCDIYLDYSTGLISYSVNGSSLDATLDGAGYPRTFNTSVIFDQADMQAERDRPSSGTSSGGAVIRFDNYLVEQTPAPSALGLMGLGGLLAARRRRR